MVEKTKSGRARRWILWILAMAILMPVVLFALFQIIFAIPDNLRHPSPEMFKSHSAADLTHISASNSHNAMPLWDKPTPPKDYEEYLNFRLAHDPKNVGARLYLDLQKDFTDQNIDKEINELFNPYPPAAKWRPGESLGYEQKHWLLGRRGLIELLLRLIRAGGPPLPTREEIRAIQGAQNMERFPTPNYLFFQNCGKLLAAEAQRRLDEGDVGGAVDLNSEIYPWADAVHDQFLIGSLITIAIQQIGNQELRAWIEQGPRLPPKLARPLSDSLAAHPMPMREMRFAMEEEYRRARAITMEVLNTPTHLLIGSIIKEKSQWLLAMDGSELLSASVHCASSSYQFVRTKANAPSLIREYDSYWDRVFRSAEGPYRALPNEQSLIATISSSSPFRSGGIPSFTEAFTRSSYVETGLNLNRSALDIIIEGAPLGKIDPKSDNWIHSAWRDPFTESPLKVVDEGKDTLIYSLGPDLQDQQGALAYDPSNGTFSAGDLAIRVPRR